MTEPLDTELLKDLTGLGKPPEYKDFRFSFRIHMSLVGTVSHVDGQVRSRTKSDLLGNSEIAGRCTSEVLHADVRWRSC